MKDKYTDFKKLTFQLLAIWVNNENQDSKLSSYT